MRLAIIAFVALAVSGCDAWTPEGTEVSIQPRNYEIVPLGPNSWLQIRAENSQVRYCEGFTRSVRCSPYIDANVASAVQSGREVVWEAYPVTETIPPQGD